MKKDDMDKLIRHFCYENAEDLPEVATEYEKTLTRMMNIGIIDVNEMKEYMEEM